MVTPVLPQSFHPASLICQPAQSCKPITRNKSVCVCVFCKYTDLSRNIHWFFSCSECWLMPRYLIVLNTLSAFNERVFFFSFEAEAASFPPLSVLFFHSNNITGDTLPLMIFPKSLAAKCGHVTTFWLMSCDLKKCVWFSSLVLQGAEEGKWGACSLLDHSSLLATGIDQLE